MEDTGITDNTCDDLLLLYTMVDWQATNQDVQQTELNA
jgi:hypothetical protein